MTDYPNRNVLWAETLVEELAAGGLDAVCVSPGSRSTPLTMAFAAHDDVEVFSHLDERSAAFFALGRSRRTGEPTALVCTSGTAAANYHPAVLEADEARVPLLALTADRPPELRDSGANQTVDQEKLYGDAVRWYRDLPEPEATPRKLRRLRTDAARALVEARGTPAGPVHVNCPFRKPLEPTPVDGDVPSDWADGDDRAAAGRPGRPYVASQTGRPTLSASRLEALAADLAAAETGLVVAGPADPRDVASTDSTLDGTAANGSTAANESTAANGDTAANGSSYAQAIAALATTAEFPLLADPLSTLRYGPHVPDAPVLGGYDAYAETLLETVDPDVVVRFGASPTSKPLRKALAAADRDGDLRQVLVDPAGGWRDAEFVASDLVVADPTHVAAEVAARLDGSASDAGGAAREATARALALDEAYFDAVEAARTAESVGAFEGEVLGDVLARAPDPATVVVGNSMPVRDADRFGEPRDADVTVLGNRGASGIDGVTSTALGAGSATTDDLVFVTGDLGFYHDMNGLLALGRCDVDATIVVVNNDGGGIFHELPIAEFDPPFTEHFETPHGLDFESTEGLYDLEFERVAPADFADAFGAALERDGSHVVEVGFDATASHDARDAVTEFCRERLADVVESDADAS